MLKNHHSGLRRQLLCLFIVSNIILNTGLAQEAPEDRKRLILSLESKEEARSYEGYFGGASTDLQVAGITVLRAMRERATLSQRELVTHLNSLKTSGDIDDFKPLWLVNAVIVEGRASVMADLSSYNGVRSVYEDIALYNRLSEPEPVDTSLFNKLVVATQQMRQSVRNANLDQITDASISIIGGELPEVLQYPPLNLRVQGSSESALPETGVANWDWLAVTAAGWTDVWDTLGVATEAEILYYPEFDDEEGVQLSRILTLLQGIVDPDVRQIKPDVVLLLWDPKFGNEFKLLWDAIGAIEASELPIVVPYPKGSAAHIEDLPGIFVQGSWETSSAPESVLRIPQLLHTPEGSVYFSDIVSAGYAAGAIFLLKTADDRALIKRLFSSMNYSSGYDNQPALNLSSARTALEKGVTKVEGIVTRKASREPEGGLLVEAVVGGEIRRTVTDDHGGYSLKLVVDDALVRVSGRQFYPDSVIVDLRSRGNIKLDFSLVPKERITITGQIEDDQGNHLIGEVTYYVGYEEFASVKTDSDGFFTMSILPGTFRVQIIPQFPYAVREIRRHEVSPGANHTIFSVKKADVGIISLDAGKSLLRYYAEALDSLELSYGFHIWEGDGANLGRLMELDYKTLIIYSGDKTPLASATVLLDSVRNLLLAGGHAILSGQRIAEFLGNVPLLTESKISFGGNVDNLLVYTATSDGSPQYLALSGAGGADNQSDPDRLVVPLEAEVPFYYDQEFKSPAGAIVPFGKDGSLAVLGFGIESVYSPYGSNQFARRNSVLDRVLQSLWSSTTGLVEINRLEIPVPEGTRSIRLMQNYPNPFEDETEIRFYIPQPARVEVVIFNIAGDLVLNLMDDQRDLGGYSLVWRSNGRGMRLPSGIYICRLTITSNTGVKRNLLSKMLHL